MYPIYGFGALFLPLGVITIRRAQLFSPPPVCRGSAPEHLGSPEKQCPTSEETVDDNISCALLHSRLSELEGACSP